MTSSARKNALISSVKSMYERGAIPRLVSATALMRLASEDKTKEFDKRFNKFDRLENASRAEEHGKKIAAAEPEEEVRVEKENTPDAKFT